MNRQQHDELSRLFSQSMQLSQRNEELQHPPSVQHVSQQSEKQQQQQPNVHFISSHYTGTAYVRPDTTSEPSRSPPPPYYEALMPAAMYESLRQHGINPSALLPNQVNLFQHADIEQRQRLLELWRIAPPVHPLVEHMKSTWSPTSVEREETLAEVRFEQQRLIETGEYREDHMLDTHIPLGYEQDVILQPMSPSNTSVRPATRHGEPEPYMINGYGMEQHEQHVRSTDPVYAAAVAPSYAHAVGQQGGMENQYGMYEQLRNHADWERSNELAAREQLNRVQISADDHDMEL